MHCLYFVHREGLTAVTRSQVVLPLSLMQSRFGVKAKVVFSLPLGHWLRAPLRRAMRAIACELTEEYGLSTSFFPTSPSKYRHWQLDRLMLRRMVQSLPKRDAIVIARNSQATLAAIKACQGKNLPILFDARGAEPAETLQRLSRRNGDPTFPSSRSDDGDSESIRSEYEAARRIETLAAQRSHGWLCVSQKLKDYLSAQTNTEKPYIVQPCGLSSKNFLRSEAFRSEKRRMLGLDGKLVICYLGSLAWYQLPEAGLAWFSQLRQVIPHAHLLAITPSQKEYACLAAKLGVDAGSCTIVSAKPEAVPDLLAAADYGLLLRDDSIVNRVASPVKFAEYLAAGVPVMISEGLGDYTEAVRQHQLGIVLPTLQPDPASIEHVIQALSQWPHEPNVQRRCLHFASQALDWDQLLETRYQFLQTCLQQTAPN